MYARRSVSGQHPKAATRDRRTKVWTADDGEAGKQLARALEYFGGTVDVYQVHNLVAWRKRLDQLERLKAEGAVRAIGLTHYSATAYDGLRDAMEDRRVGAIQIPYNPHSVTWKPRSFRRPPTLASA